MNIDNLLEKFRNMNHLIELDEMPDLVDGEWNQGWVRFYDTLNTSVVCVKYTEEFDEDDGEEYEEGSSIGDITVCINDYKLNVYIPTNKVDKFVNAEQKKSDMLNEGHVIQDSSYKKFK
jgi:hypothetical protein